MSSSEDIEQLAHRADQGDAEAMFEVGERIYEGRGFDENQKEGVNWIAKAAEAGHVVAQELMGTYYWTGTYRDEDLYKARMFLESAARQGSRGARQKLRKVREDIHDEEHGMFRFNLDILDAWRNHQFDRVRDNPLQCPSCSRATAIGEVCEQCGEALLSAARRPIARRLMYAGGLIMLPLAILGIFYAFAAVRVAINNPLVIVAIGIAFIGLITHALRSDLPLFLQGAIEKQPRRALLVRFGKQMMTEERIQQGARCFAEVLTMEWQQTQFKRSELGETDDIVRYWERIESNKDVPKSLLEALRDLLYEDIAMQIFLNADVSEHREERWWKLIGNLANDSPALIDLAHSLKSMNETGTVSPNIAMLAEFSRARAPEVANILAGEETPKTASH